MRSSYWLIVSLLLTVIPAFAQQMSHEELPPNQQKIESIEHLAIAIEALRIEREIPAVSVAMMDDNGPVLIKTFGFSNAKTKEVATNDHLFRIGSVSKMFVGLAVLKLVEEGRLSLNDNLAELAPTIEYKNPWRESYPIKVVHLLEHTTGWNDVHLPEFNYNLAGGMSLEKSLAFHPHSRESQWIPGSRMAYSNSGVAVAAYLVEQVAGQSFERYVAENLFKPMGMSAATYFKNENVVQLHAKNNEPDGYSHLLLRPSGAVNASVNDMAQFLSFFIHRGKVGSNQLLSAESLDRMETTESTSAAKVGQQIGYGLTNYTKPHHQWKYRSHNGALPGGFADFSYLPSKKVGHAIAINSSDFSGLKAISTLIRDFETQNFISLPVKPELNVTNEHKKIEGIYLKINENSSLTRFIHSFGFHKLQFEGDRLTQQSLVSSIIGGSKISFYPISDSQYKDVNSGLISLTQTSDPLVGPVVHSRTTVLKPVSSLRAYGSFLILILWVLAIISSLLFFIVWGTRKLQGKIPAGAAIQVRIWPLLASICIVSILATGMLFGSMPLFAAPSVLSVGILVLSILYALCSLMSVYVVLKYRKASSTEVNTSCLWYSIYCASIHLIATVYLYANGGIGFASWQ